MRKHFFFLVCSLQLRKPGTECCGKTRGGTSEAERHWKRVTEVDRIRNMGFEPEPPTVKKRLTNGGPQEAVTNATMDQYKTGEEEKRLLLSKRDIDKTNQANMEGNPTAPWAGYHTPRSCHCVKEVIGYYKSSA